MAPLILVLLGLCAQEPAPTPPTPPPTTTTVAPNRVLVLDPFGDGVAPAVLRTLGDLVAGALQQEPGLAVSTGRDIAAVMGLAAEQQAAGCDLDSTSCLAEVAGALGASLVVSTNAAQLDEVLVVTISLYDARQSASVGRERLEVEKLSALPKEVDRAMARILGRAVADDPAPAPLALIGAGVAGVGVVVAAFGGIGAALAANTITTPTTAGTDKDAAQGNLALMAAVGVIGGVVAVIGAGVGVWGLQ